MPKLWLGYRRFIALPPACLVQLCSNVFFLLSMVPHLMNNAKSIGVAAASLIGIVAIAAGIKITQFSAMGEAQASTPPPSETVSTFTTEIQKWPNSYTAMGTVEASEGIVITAEVA